LLLPLPFAILSSSVTAAAFPIVHRHSQTPLLTIAICCLLLQLSDAILTAVALHPLSMPRPLNAFKCHHPI
jgi:hypothetical protein